jgi:hypothetical protein
MLKLILGFNGFLKQGGELDDIGRPFTLAAIHFARVFGLSSARVSVRRALVYWNHPFV